MIKSLIALCTGVMALQANASETISIIWPFSVGDTQAQYSRSLVEVLNRSPQKNVFIFENRPGAGASIAARHVLRHPNTVLSASTSFFIRPIFYPTESHKVEQFRPLITQCAAPMVLISAKYKDLNYIPRDQSVTIGVSGLGTTTHLLSLQIAKKLPNAVVVPYKGTRDASQDVLAGHIDMSIAFMGEIEQYLDAGRLNGLGVTGPRPIRDIPTLKSKGINRADEIVNMHSLLVPKTMPDSMVQYLRHAVTKAAQSADVQSAYKVDWCQYSVMDPAATELWFEQQIKLWHDLSRGVRLNGI